MGGGEREEKEEEEEAEGGGEEVQNTTTELHKNRHKKGLCKVGVNYTLVKLLKLLIR